MDTRVTIKMQREYLKKVSENEAYYDMYGRGFALPRMWAQYAHNHNGVCFIFNKEKLINKIESDRSFFVASSVNYADIVSTYHIKEKQVNSLYNKIKFDSNGNLPYLTEMKNNDFLKYNFFSKSADWSNEQEYRIIIYTNSSEAERQKISTISDAIEGIVIGERIDDTHKDVLRTYGFKRIMISKLGCDAEIIIDYHLLDAVITDIVLDIIMFNSYSFLKAMTIKEKREFSQQKYRFFVENKLTCIYDYKNEKPLYYSLAFSARTDSSSFDLKYYISLWDKFIETYYRDKKHIEKSVKEQLSQHVDKGELPKRVYKKFDDYSEGAYLLLRTNKDRTEKIHPQLYKLFSIKKFRKGKLKIVSIAEFEKYKPLLKNLDVSVFKVVVQ